MKRFFSIVLLSVHLFYIGGYALFFQYYIHEADVQMVKRVFDDKINDAKLIEIKIPAHSPILTEGGEYEIVSGQIQLKNAYYNYVKLKITADTMYFVCLPNTAKTRLVNANIITAKEISDVPLSKNGHAPSVKKISALSEYNLQSFNYQFSGPCFFVKQYNRSVSLKLVVPYIESPGKPPNLIG